MRNFIRIHPWRLEIVPAAAILLAVGSVFCYSYSPVALIARAAARAEGGTDPIASMLVWKLGLAASLWMGEIGCNHRWVLAEQCKRFNWMALGQQFMILGFAVTAFIVVRTVSLVPHYYIVSDRVPMYGLLREWGILMALGVGVTALLESTRKHSHLLRGSEPVPPNGSALPYVETEFDGSIGLSFIPIAATSLALAFQGDTGLAVLALSASILAAAILTPLARRKVIVSSDYIRLSAGFIRKRIDFSEIESCQPSHFQPFSRRPRLANGKRPKPLLVSTGRCLEVTTKSGEVYYLGMMRPTYACGLIESVMQERQSENSIDTSTRISQ